MFEKIKKFYALGLYTDENLKIFLKAEYITQDEYEKIKLLKREVNTLVS